MVLTDSKRAKRPESYYRRKDYFRRPSRTKTTSALVTAAKCRSSHALVNNGSCVIRKRRKRSPSYAIVSFTSFPRIGKRFTRNGWKTSRTGASVVRFGGDTRYQLGIRNPKFQIPNPKFTSGLNLQLIPKTGRKIQTRSTLGSHRGCGPTRPWMKKHGKNFIRRACW